MKKILWIGIILSVVFIGVAIVFYYISFKDSEPADHTKLSEFGSFLSGTVGVLLSGLSLIAFIHLTWRISSQEDQKHLTDLRLPSYLNLLSELNQFDRNDLTEQDARDLFEFLDVTDFDNILFLTTVDKANIQAVIDKIQEPIRRKVLQAVWKNGKEIQEIRGGLNSLRTILREIMVSK